MDNRDYPRNVSQDAGAQPDWGFTRHRTYRPRAGQPPTRRNHQASHRVSRSATKGQLRPAFLRSHRRPRWVRARRAFRMSPWPARWLTIIAIIGAELLRVTLCHSMFRHNDLLRSPLSLRDVSSLLSLFPPPGIFLTDSAPKLSSRRRPATCSRRRLRSVGRCLDGQPWSRQSPTLRPSRAYVTNTSL